MSTTKIPFGDPRAVKRWSADLAVDVRKKSYFEQRFIGTSENSVIQRKTELESDSGDTISFDLSVHLRGKPTYGDNRLEGKEENLRFYTDQVRIDQVRHSASAGGRMSRKRTVHNIRRLARDRLGDYFYKFLDEVLFIYLSGARGINKDFTEDETYQGFAGNRLKDDKPVPHRRKQITGRRRRQRLGPTLCHSPPNRCPGSWPPSHSPSASSSLNDCR